MKTSETVSSGVEATSVNKKSKSSESDKEIKKSSGSHQPPTPSINSSESVRTCQNVSSNSTTKPSYNSDHKVSSSPHVNGKVSDKSSKVSAKSVSPNTIKISTKKSGSPTSVSNSIYGKTTSEKFECLISSTTASSPPKNSELKKISVKPDSSLKKERDPIPL